MNHRQQQAAYEQQQAQAAAYYAAQMQQQQNPAAGNAKYKSTVCNVWYAFVQGFCETMNIFQDYGGRLSPWSYVQLCAWNPWTEL